MKRLELQKERESNPFVFSPAENSGDSEIVVPDDCVLPRICLISGDTANLKSIQLYISGHSPGDRVWRVLRSILIVTGLAVILFGILWNIFAVPILMLAPLPSLHAGQGRLGPTSLIVKAFLREDILWKTRLQQCLLGACYLPTVVFFAYLILGKLAVLAAGPSQTTIVMILFTIGSHLVLPELLGLLYSLNPRTVFHLSARWSDQGWKIQGVSPQVSEIFGRVNGTR